MAEKKYTVEEIDDLRRALRERYMWGNANGPHFAEVHSAVVSRSYKETEMSAVVEDQLRTFMLAGVSAQDLRDEDGKWQVGSGDQE